MLQYYLEELEYGRKVVSEIEKYVESNSDTMLKEDWVRKNPIIRGPAQMLYDMLKQGTSKTDLKSLSSKTDLPSVTTRRGSTGPDATRNKPVLQALKVRRYVKTVAIRVVLSRATARRITLHQKCRKK